MEELLNTLHETLGDMSYKLSRETRGTARYNAIKDDYQFCEKLFTELYDRLYARWKADPSSVGDEVAYEFNLADRADLEAQFEGCYGDLCRTDDYLFEMGGNI